MYNRSIWTKCPASWDHKVHVYTSCYMWYSLMGNLSDSKLKFKGSMVEYFSERDVPLKERTVAGLSENFVASI